MTGITRMMAGIGLGVANACLAAQQFAGGDEAFQAVANVQAADDAAAPADCEHHSVAVLDQSWHDQQDSKPKSNCESFCERAGVTIPPQKSVLDNYQFHVLPLPMVAALVVPAAAFFAGAFFSAGLRFGFCSRTRSS